MNRWLRRYTGDPTLEVSPRELVFAAIAAPVLLAAFVAVCALLWLAVPE